jgi:hypothetical protein
MGMGESDKGKGRMRQMQQMQSLTECTESTEGNSESVLKGSCIFPRIKCGAGSVFREKRRFVRPVCLITPFAFKLWARF